MSDKSMQDLPTLFHADDIKWDSFPAGSGNEADLRFKLLAGGVNTSSPTGLTVGISEIPCGKGVAPHHHSQLEYYYVVKGEGVVHLGDETLPIKPGSIAYAPEKTVHGIHNTGDELLLVWFIIQAHAFSDVDYEMI